MTERWNIQISIQRVTTQEVEKGNARGLAQQVSGKDREVTKVLELAVVADTEREAYAKAHRMLSASEPEWPEEIVADGTVVGRTSGGTYRPIRDNPQA